MTKPPGAKNERELQPADLRGILKYVPMWRDHTFVVAIDGRVILDDGFAAVMVELAVLHNLGIRLVVVFGIGGPLQRRAETLGVPLTDVRGEGPVDDRTLELAVDTSGSVLHLLVQALSQNRVRCAAPNAIRATERGVIKGVDQIHGGRVDRVDHELLRNLMAQQIVPILGPMAFTRDGRPLRLNSDELAASVAETLSASKLVFLMAYPGLTLEGIFQLNLSIEELEAVLLARPHALDEEVRSRASFAIRTIKSGVPRAHLLDARIPDALLTEIFSTVGVGTMIHANPYAQVRRARRSDVGALHQLTKTGIKDETLRTRTRAEIEASFPEYFVYEIDQTIMGCCRLSPLGSKAERSAELMSVFVHRFYGRRGIGRALVEAALDAARTAGFDTVYAVSTQAAPFFVEVCGFQELEGPATPSALLQRTVQEARRGRILMRDLSDRDRESAQRKGIGT
ncbi:MAG: amino-acid N-acetyltransferase [Myxococcota bacterium]